jgi:hypothetical protein
MYRICSLVPVFGSEFQPSSGDFHAKSADFSVEETTGRPVVSTRLHPLLPVGGEAPAESKRDLLEMLFLSGRA